MRYVYLTQGLSSNVSFDLVLCGTPHDSAVTPPASQFGPPSWVLTPTAEQSALYWHVWDVSLLRSLGAGLGRVVSEVK